MLREGTRAVDRLDATADAKRPASSVIREAPAQPIPHPANGPTMIFCKSSLRSRRCRLLSIVVLLLVAAGKDSVIEAADTDAAPGTTIELQPLSEPFGSPVLITPGGGGPADSYSDDAFDDQSADVQYAPVSETGFWFLSTANSPQKFRHTCPRFCPAISRYDQCAGFRRSDLAELSGSLEPGVPVCIVIHGSFVDTPSACRESVGVWNWLRSAGCGDRMQMIYFNWPSFRPMTPLVAADVNMLGHRAARNGYYLAELIQFIPPECPICLMGHSHGTRVVASGLHLLAGGVVEGVRHPTSRAHGRSIRTVFSASAIDHHWLCPGKKYDRALCSTECVLNLHNCVDPALRVYSMRLPFIASRPLGLNGLSNRDRRRLGSVGRRIVDYDVSREVGGRHLWPNYFHNPRLAMVVRNYVYFPDRAAMVSR